MRELPVEIRNFSKMFVELQNVRQESDYALDTDAYRKSDVLEHIASAERKPSAGSNRRMSTLGAVSPHMCYSDNGHRRFNMNNHHVHILAEAAFKACFGDVDIKPGFDHYDDAMLDVKIIYGGEVEQLIAQDKVADTMDVRPEIVEKVWKDAQDSPSYPFVHFIAKSDIGQCDPVTVCHRDRQERYTIS